MLKKGPSYGYMIIRELEQCVEISESTLYPILKRLEQNGSLETYRKEYNGRMRKYYCLTKEGQHKIDQFLEEWDELQNMYRFVEVQNMQQAKVQDPEETEPDQGKQDPEETELDQGKADLEELEAEVNLKDQTIEISEMDLEAEEQIVEVMEGEVL